MLGWLPIIGPIIDGIVSIFTKFKDTELGKYQVDGTVDVATIKASQQMLSDFKDDIGVRLARDIVMFPVCVVTAIVSWDSLVVHQFPSLYWKIAAYPPSLSYLPYAVIMFLFGAVAMKAWRR